MPRFWTVAIPFGLVILAQVGFVVHLVAFLRPQLGATCTAQAVALVATAAMAGRLALGVVIDRLDQGLVIGLNTAIVQFTFAFGPALLGMIRDMAGSYTPALGLCIAAELAAATIVLAGRR